MLRIHCKVQNDAGGTKKHPRNIDNIRYGFLTRFLKSWQRDSVGNRCQHQKHVSWNATCAVSKSKTMVIYGYMVIYRYTYGYYGYIYIWENMWKTPQVSTCFPHLWRHLDLTGQVFFLDSRCAEVNSICWDPWPQVLRHKWCAKNQCSAWQTARGHLDPMAQRLKNKNGLSKYGSHRTYIYIT